MKKDNFLRLLILFYLCNGLFAFLRHSHLDNLFNYQKSKKAFTMIFAQHPFSTLQNQLDMMIGTIAPHQQQIAYWGDPDLREQLEFYLHPRPLIFTNTFNSLAHFSWALVDQSSSNDVAQLGTDFTLMATIPGADTDQHFTLWQRKSL